MIALKVIGLSHRPQIIVSRPASIRLAMAISPSRLSSSTAPISRRYMRTGSSVRSTVSFFFSRTIALAVAGSTSSTPRRRPRPRCVVLVGFLVLDDVDAHLAERGHDVLDLLGGHLVLRQRLVELVIGDVAALLGAGDQLLERGFVEVDQRRIAGLGLLVRAPPPVRLRHLQPCSTVGLQSSSASNQCRKLRYPLRRARSGAAAAPGSAASSPSSFSRAVAAASAASSPGLAASVSIARIRSRRARSGSASRRVKENPSPVPAERLQQSSPATLSQYGIEGLGIKRGVGHRRFEQQHRASAAMPGSAIGSAAIASP